MLLAHHISRGYPGRASLSLQHALLPPAPFLYICPRPAIVLQVLPVLPVLHQYRPPLYRRFSPFCPYYRHNPELLLRDGSHFLCPREHLQNLSSRSGGLLDVVVDLDFKPLLEQTHWK